MGNSRSRGIIYVHEDGFVDEREPMLGVNGQDRLSGVHGRIEVEDGTPPKPTIVEAIRQRFTFVYIVLGLVFLISLAVLVVAIMLLCNMKKMDQRYKNMTSTGSERFMKLYEEVSNAKGTRRDPKSLNDIVDKLSPEQLAQARAFGLLPKEQPNLGEPIKPALVSGAKDKDVGQDVSRFMSASLDDLPTQIKNEANDFYSYPWHDSSCLIQCNKADITVPPLIVISLDGFSSEYLDKRLVPSLEKLSECGAKARYMYPSYPSKTFPNHYTIATGLYPGSHGIFDRYLYDPTISPALEDISKTKQNGYFKGEPIWSSVVRQQRKMNCLMWPGCSFNITGFNPTVDVPYNKNLTYSARVQMIVDWLNLNANERPDLIMAYFDQPDTAGHFHQSEQEVNLALSYIESVLNFLLTTLKNNNLLDCVNLIILSDHGMQDIKNRVYLDSLNLNMKDMVIASGVISRIYMANSTKTAESILDKLKCTGGDKFNIYDRKQLPLRYHYSNPRVGDVIFDDIPGSTIFKNKQEDYHVVADHGYDYIYKKMHAIFFARGPNIRPNIQVDPFQNVELFNFFAELLRINNDVPNNGTKGSITDILHNINSLGFPVPDTTLRPVQECDPIAPLERRHMKPCTDSTSCQEEAQIANAKLDGCPVQVSSPGVLYTDRSNTSYCFINLCSVLTFVDLHTAFGVPTFAFETLTLQDLPEERPIKPSNVVEEPCVLNDLRYEPSCDNWTAIEQQKHESSLRWTSIMANQENEISHYNRLQFLLHRQVVDGPFLYLQNLTSHYARRYSRILSFTGAVYDFDMNGIADDQTVFWNHVSSGHTNEERAPSHIVRVLIRCADGAWHINGANCKHSTETHVLAFVIPNAPVDLNCLSPNDYLLKNSARVKDVELLSGVEFFRERMWYPERDSMKWRLNIVEELWPL